jgi:hypothetical protein
MPSLPPHATRRRRRLDVVPAATPGAARFDAHFRDSHVDAHGVERCVHEYTVVGEIDTVRRTIVDLTTRARVLPWQECPGAVASAGRVREVPLTDLRDYVRAEFAGVSTCTHLNDTLRSFADADTLLTLMR